MTKVSAAFGIRGRTQFIRFCGSTHLSGENWPFSTDCQPIRHLCRIVRRLFLSTWEAVRRAPGGFRASALQPFLGLPSPSYTQRRGGRAANTELGQPSAHNGAHGGRNRGRTAWEQPDGARFLRKRSMGPVAKGRVFGVFAPAPNHLFGLFNFNGNRSDSRPTFGVGPIAVGLVLRMPASAPMFHAGRFVLHIRTFLSHSRFGHGSLLWDKPTAPLCQNRPLHGLFLPLA